MRHHPVDAYGQLCIPDCTEVRRKVQDFQVSRFGLHRLSRVNEGLHRDARWLNESTTSSLGAKNLSECKAVTSDDFGSHEMYGHHQALQRQFQ